MIRQQRLSSRSSWLVILSLLALLTVPITAQQTPTQCTPNPYQGFCSSIGITSTSLPANVSSQIEAAIQASPLKNKLLSLGILDFECATLLQSFICVEKFPQCVGTGTTAVQQRVCKSSCSAAVQACSAAFQRAGLKDPLPNCDANTDPAFARTAPLADDVQGGAVCVKSERFLANVASNFTCPFPFIANPYYPNGIPSQLCNGPCCVPCPLEEIFQPPGVFKAQTRVHHFAHFIAFFLVLYVVISYSILPGRREHPADIVLYFAIAVCIWMSVSLWVLPDVRKVQCLPDGVTPSTALTNRLCGVQAAWLLLGVHSAVFWGAFMIWNLHLTILHKTTVLARYKLVGILFCYGIPAVLTTFTVVRNDVDASSGAVCFLSSAGVKYSFAIQGLIVVPAVFANLATFVHIARVARRASSMASQSSDGEIEMDRYGAPVPKREGSRRQILQLVKLNWRALLLGVVFLTTYLVYFTFYLVLSATTNDIKPSTPWVQEFFLCLITTPPSTAQDFCTKKFASFLPSSGVVITAYVTTGLVGVWLFVIFGLQGALVRDWRIWWSERRKPKVPMGVGGVPQVGKWVQV